MTSKGLRYSTLCALALLWCSWSAHAQLASPFTVLSNNTDIQNKKLYVEIMYEKPACGDYQARFRMVSNSGLDTVVAVDSFLNNPGTYQLSSDGKRLMRPQAGGYRLRFNLPAGATPTDSLRVCIDAYKMSYRCVGCAASGSDAIFGPSDVDMLCPYSNTAGNDLLACYQRSSREGNWEAWITDPRDCQPYRIVLMPDNKWWFAQNLRYTKDLVNSGNANKGLSGDAPSNNTLFGNYWCPGGLTIEDGEVQTNTHSAAPANNATLATGGLTACNTYGALYTWPTAVRLDGRGMEHTPTKAGATSTTQGICPEGWLLPSDADWGMMLNAVEGCSDIMDPSTSPPCNHYLNDTRTSEWLGATAAASLKSTLSAPPHAQLVDTTIATATLPAWPWRRADYSGKVSSPLALGKDKYGFGVLPAGYRHHQPSSGFINLGNAAYFWTSTPTANDSRAMHRKFDYQHAEVYRNVDNPGLQKWSGFSIRCVRKALPAITGIKAPSSIAYQTTKMAAEVPQREGTWTYTWSVSSSEISNIGSKVTFSPNQSSAAYSVNATLALEQGNVGKSFTIKLVMSNGTSSKTLTKTVSVVSLVASISISPYSVGGKVTATANVDASGRYSYAWGDGSQDFSQDKTSAQTIQTGAGTAKQTKTWYLKVKDLKTGVVSSQLSASYTFPSIPDGTTFCSACASNGSQNVDAWLSPMDDSGSLTTTSVYGLANATDINNGRQNTLRLKAEGVAGDGVYACLRKGEGWYVAAAEEYCRIKESGLSSAAVLDASGTWLSTIQTASKEKMGISCWNVAEPSGNGPGIVVWKNFLLDDNGTTTTTHRLVCIWRPKDGQ
jgi:hypothetical protein